MCAMFQSPHSTISRPSPASSFRCGKKYSMNLNLIGLALLARSSPKAGRPRSPRASRNRRGGSGPSRSMSRIAEALLDPVRLAPAVECRRRCSPSSPRSGNAPCSPSARFISGVMSPACAFSSCTHTTSARWRGSHLKKPLRAAERMPFRFSVIIFIAAFRASPRCPFDRTRRRAPVNVPESATRRMTWPPTSGRSSSASPSSRNVAALRRVQDQGGAPVSVFFQRRAVLRRRGAETARPILRESDTRERHRLRHAVRAGIQGHSARRGGRDRARRRRARRRYSFNRKEAKDHGEGGNVDRRARSPGAS